MQCTHAGHTEHHDAFTADEKAHRERRMAKLLVHDSRDIGDPVERSKISARITEHECRALAFEAEAKRIRTHGK